MIKTFRISFALKNTYRVNGIIHSIRQIPLIKRLVPQAAYGVGGFKVLANVLSAIWEVVTVFLGKFLYFLLMVAGIGALYDGPADRIYLHILAILSVIGAFSNTYMFNPTRDKYYAMILMRMDARSYTLTNYGYALLKLIVGFLPFSLYFGMARGVPVWLCLLIPFAVAGMKAVAAAMTLRDYEKTGRATNENKLDKWAWVLIAVFLAAAYGLPALRLSLPAPVSAAFFILSFAAGLLSLRKILSFDSYTLMYKELLADSLNQMDAMKDAAKKQSERAISADTSIVSHRKGFEYMNELFVKRHRRILWKASERIAYVCLALVLGLWLLFYLQPEFKAATNRVLMTFLPYFVFIMYAINRGTNFTQALFMNCDRSLLTYSFFKEPRMILRLFAIRLREIVKVNLLPAAVIGGGLALLLWQSGGTENSLDYAVLVVSILAMSVFFSVHYLTIYYLLQPYTAGTELKSGTYRLVTSATYFVCYFMMQVRLPIQVFGLACIAFCVLYCAAACVLVYRLAPKTFRIRV